MTAIFRRRTTPHSDPGRRILRRMGALGFLFFLGKGLLWLALPALAVLSR